MMSTPVVEVSTAHPQSLDRGLDGRTSAKTAKFPTLPFEEEKRTARPGEIAWLDAVELFNRAEGDAP